MHQPLGSFSSGLDCMDKQITMIADNMAKSSVHGHKQKVMVFAERMSSYSRYPGAANQGNSYSPTGVFTGSGVQAMGTISYNTMGPIEETGNDSNLAIMGSGYFTVQLPDGTIGYTRDGNFSYSAEGRLETPEGYPLVPEVVIPENAEKYQIDKDGNVLVTIDNKVQNIALLNIAIFHNPSGLAHKYSNIYVETENGSGPALIGQPGQAGYGYIKQHALEKSNVDTINLITEMISVNRVYEMLSKGLKTCDQMWQNINNSSGA